MTTPVTLLVLLAVLVGAAYWGWQTLVSSPVEGGQARKHQRCGGMSPRDAGRLGTGEVTVNVYNAGSRQGLATSTADRLRRRGFNVQTVDNTRAKVRDVRVVARGQRTASVRLVSKQFRGGVDKRADDRRGDQIDVILGDKFGGVRRDSPRFVDVPAKANPCERRSGPQGR